MFTLLIFLLAFGVGFSSRRGGICLVAATAEIIETGKAKTLLFVIEAMIVSLAITVPAMLLFPTSFQGSQSYGLSFLFIIGAFLYGVGGAINGGCALGSMNKLMSGHVNFFGTIIGIGIGLAIPLVFAHKSTALINEWIMSNASTRGYLFAIVAVVWLVVLWRLWHHAFRNTHSFQELVQQFIHSALSRNVLAIFMLGACAALLFLMLGHSWDYTSWIWRFQREYLVGASRITASSQFITVSITTMALMLGVFTASIVAHSFQLRLFSISRFLTKLVAGGLMGYGAHYIYGGNDTLVLYGLPTAAIHAPFAILFIMLAIAMVLLFKARFLG